MEGITKRAYRFIVGATLLTTFSFAQIQKINTIIYKVGVVSGYTGYKTVDLPITTSFVVGFGKESLDYIQYGKFDNKDLLATTLGGVAVSLTIKLINKKVKMRKLIIALFAVIVSMNAYSADKKEGLKRYLSILLFTELTHKQIQYKHHKHLL